MIRDYAEIYSAQGYIGEGMTTSEQVQSNNVTPEMGADIKTQGKSENVFAAWLLVAGILIGLTLLAEKFSVGETYGQVKLGFYNMIVITVYVVLGLSIGKVFFSKVKIPGLSVLFTSV